MKNFHGAHLPVKKMTLKERFAALRNLPEFFRLVWRTNPRMTLLSCGLRGLRAVLPLLLLYIGKLIIDDVVTITHGGHFNGHLWRLVAAEFALAVLTDGLNRAIALLDNLQNDLFAYYASTQVMTHAASLDLDQFEDSHFYDKLERARQQTVGRTMLLSQVMGQAQDLVTMVFLSAGLAAFNPWLIALLVVAIVPAFLGEVYFNDQSYDLARWQTPERRELDYLRYLGASDETAKEVKVFSLSGFLIERFEALSRKFYAENRILATQRAAWGTLFALLGSAGYYAAYVFIIMAAVQGRLSIGSLTFLAGSFKQLRASLENILSRFSTVSQGAMYLRDFFEFFEVRPRITQPAQPKPFPKPLLKGIEFENVSFRYTHADKYAIRDLSFTLHPGEKLALVGGNGAGKTTLVKLLARLYDPTEGRILLDGVDLRDYDLVSLRMNIGIIFQDYLRYQMSFADNVAAGNIPEKDNSDLIQAAAQRSLAHDVAERLPRKYAQMLGRRFLGGVDLSGGEWQKVALARAYMRDAQILILDEPTSALDARAEYDVFQRFTELTAGKSAVLISHRFSTVRMADRILVLENGMFAEFGSHEELMKLGGRYAELFNLQATGYR